MTIHSTAQLEAILRRYNVKYQRWTPPGRTPYVRVFIRKVAPIMVMDVSCINDDDEHEWQWCLPCPESDFACLPSSDALKLPMTW